LGEWAVRGRNGVTAALANDRPQKGGRTTATPSAQAGPTRCGDGADTRPLWPFAATDGPGAPAKTFLC